MFRHFYDFNIFLGEIYQIFSRLIKHGYHFILTISWAFCPQETLISGIALSQKT
jgi:hypothetical protein